MSVFEGHAILELMGHRRLAGHVSEVEIAGGKFLRLDVPSQTPGEPPVATQFYSPGAIYCITPTSEETARAVAKGAQPAPVQRWELPQLAQARDIEDDGEREEDLEAEEGRLP